MDMMRRRSLRWLSIVGLVLVTLVLLFPTSARTDPTAAANGDVIVVFRDGTDVSLRHHVLQQAGAVARRHFQVVGAAAASLPHAGVRAFLERHPDVVAIVPDRPVYAYAKGGGVAAATSTQVVPAGVQRIGAAPGSLSWTGLGVGVAVVDTGLDFNHKDLKPLGVGCFTAFTSCQDNNGHGTHVGGIIAARNNTVDVVGVAPNATLYAVKVLNSAGSGTDSTIIAGLDWIAAHPNLSPPIRVVNMSLGRPGTVADDPALRSAVQLLYGQGISIVVAAGNDSSVQVSQQVPATYPEVMAVASTTALNGTNQCAGFSGFIAADTASYFTTDGKFDSTTGIGVTISAPGEDKENITSGCYATSVGILSTRLGGGTTRLSGTSMAAPHVAGVVALMWQKFGLLDPEAARATIRSTASGIGVTPLNSPTVGYTFDGEREGIVSAPGATQ